MKEFLEKYGIYIMLIVGIVFFVVFMTWGIVEGPNEENTNGSGG